MVFPSSGDPAPEAGAAYWTELAVMLLRATEVAPRGEDTGPLRDAAQYALGVASRLLATGGS